MNGTTASVVIPAHNEGAVITRCLSSLLLEADKGEFEVVVVCNGCSDKTSLLARDFARRSEMDVHVLEIAQASKSEALNLGDTSCTTFPRIYLDADIELSTKAARQLTNELTNGKALAAAPKPEIELNKSSMVVRSFYRTWLGSPFMTNNVIGNGVYALSETGRQMFKEFPTVIVDDLFVLSLFDSDQRRCLESCSFRLFPPRRLRDLLKVRTRVYTGNAELGALDHSSSVRTLLSRTKSISSFIDLATYLIINSIAKTRAVRRIKARNCTFQEWESQEREWERDESSRLLGPVSEAAKP